MYIKQLPLLVEKKVERYLQEWWAIHKLLKQDYKGRQKIYKVLS